METFKKIAKIVAIILAVVAALAAVYYAVTKFIEKKKIKNADDRENYISCASYDADFISETVA